MRLDEGYVRLDRSDSITIKCYSIKLYRIKQPHVNRRNTRINTNDVANVIDNIRDSKRWLTNEREYFNKDMRSNPIS